MKYTKLTCPYCHTTKRFPYEPEKLKGLRYYCSNCNNITPFEKMEGFEESFSVLDKPWLFKFIPALKIKEDGRIFYILESSLTLGRKGGSEIANLQVITNDLSMSGKHIEITIEETEGGKKVFITNLSNSLCLLNNVPLNKKNRQCIEVNMEIVLGKTSFIVQDINLK